MLNSKKAWAENWPYALIFALVLFALGLGLSNLFRSSALTSVDVSGAQINMNTVLSFQSKEIKFSELLNGDKNLIVFWATWCAPCVDEIRSMPKLLPEISAKGYDTVFINYDSEENVGSALLFASEYKIESAVDDKGELLYSLGISSLPISLVVDKSGKILKTLQGEISLEDL